MGGDDKMVYGFVTPHSSVGGGAGLRGGFARARGRGNGAPHHLLDEALPRFDVNEVHTTWLPAPPEDAYRAIRLLTVGEVPIVQALLALRALPGAVIGDPLALDPSRPFIEQALELGFVELGERVPSELVLGAVGRFWLPADNRPLDRVGNREDFARFEEPGFAKAAMAFAIRPEEDGSAISTETRVRGTDPVATRRFRLYWLLVGPWSGLIRRAVLRSVRRRLERGLPAGG